MGKKLSEDEWINKYLILSPDMADIPKLNSGEEHEVKIIKNNQKVLTYEK